VPGERLGYPEFSRGDRGKHDLAVVPDRRTRSEVIFGVCDRLGTSTRGLRRNDQNSSRTVELSRHMRIEWTSLAVRAVVARSVLLV
jgi:hypothetical protein